MKSRDDYFCRGPWVLVSRDAFFWTGERSTALPAKAWWTQHLHEAKQFPTVADCYRAASGVKRLASARPRRLDRP